MITKLLFLVLGCSLLLGAVQGQQCTSDEDCHDPLRPYCNPDGVLYWYCTAEECKSSDSRHCCSDVDCEGCSAIFKLWCGVNCVEHDCVCFAPGSTVTIETPADGDGVDVAAIAIAISELKVNDRVLTGSGDFKKVIAFSTFSPASGSAAQPGSLYIKLTLASSTFIEMTPSHMIFVNGDKYPIEASNVKAGDHLTRKLPHHQNQDTIMEKVVSVDFDYLQGGFGPITEDGTIVVNGIVASCYSNPLYQNSEYVEILGIPVVHRQVFTHMLKSPVRLFCKYISDSPCQVNKDSTGIVPVKMPGHKFVDHLHEFVVKWGIEDIGEILVGVLATGFFLMETVMDRLSTIYVDFFASANQTPAIQSAKSYL